MTQRQSWLVTIGVTLICSALTGTAAYAFGARGYVDDRVNDATKTASDRLAEHARRQHDNGATREDILELAKRLERLEGSVGEMAGDMKLIKYRLGLDTSRFTPKGGGGQ